MRPELSVVIASRKNSKYMMKFLLSLMQKTSNPEDLEIFIVMNKADTWNRDLVSFCKRFLKHYSITFVEEDLGLGRGGLHEYINLCVQQAVGNWLVYFCDDHYILSEDWDGIVYDYISGLVTAGDSEGKKFPLDPQEPWVLVPKFDNAGSMNHIVSYGYLNALNNSIGSHGWIDSYINDLMRPFPERVIRMDAEIFHDFTHDVPSPMDAITSATKLSDRGHSLPKYDTTPVIKALERDKNLLAKSLGLMEVYGELPE